ncbi:MAG: PAS domain S-box protein, partial [Chloroflexi bacterium]|nr:PAS domain S-box protein [Chloroflexota bacterium]
MSETARSAATKGSKSWVLSLAQSTALKWVGLAVVLTSIAAFIVLMALDIRVAFGHPLLLPLLNTLFISLIFLTVAYIAGRVFLHTGERLLWLMGAGSFILGIAASMAGWLASVLGSNVAATVHSIGFLAAASLFTSSSIVGLSSAGRPVSPKRRVAYLLGLYGGGLALLLLVLAGSTREILPVFFVPGLGGTLIREIIFNTTGSLLAIAGLLMLVRYFQSRAEFVYWYSLGLVALGLGLIAMGFSTVVGDPMAWLSRVVQYLGSISLGFGVLVGVMEARAMGLGFDLTIARLFPAYAANYRLLFDTATDAVIALDNRGRILLWNAAATRIFSYTSAEAIGASLADLLFPGDSSHISDEIYRLSDSESQIKHLELEARRKDGQTVPVEMSLSGRMTPSGWLSA